MKSKEPYVIVLILSYNGKHLLRESLPSYLENEYPNFNVVVIDNGSSDGTKEYVESKFPRASVKRLEKNRGYSGGFNFGLDYAANERNADYILVTNDDVWADRKVIEELVKIAEKDSEIGFVTGKVYFYDVNGKKNILQTVGKKLKSPPCFTDHIGLGEEDLGQYNEISERFLCDDVFMLVRKKVVEKTKGYDEDFFLHHEEVDWQMRSRRLGYKIYYTPHAKLWHKVGMSTGGLGSPLRHFYYVRNEILIIKKHGTHKQFGRYLFKNIFYIMPKFFVVKILQKRLDLLIAHFKGFVSGFIFVLGRNSS